MTSNSPETNMRTWIKMKQISRARRRKKKQQMSEEESTRRCFNVIHLKCDYNTRRTHTLPHWCTHLALGCVKSNLSKSLFWRHGAEDANTDDHQLHIHVCTLHACTLTRMQTHTFDTHTHTQPCRCAHGGVTLVDLSVEVCSTVAAFLIS